MSVSSSRRQWRPPQYNSDFRPLPLQHHHHIVEANRKSLVFLAIHDCKIAGHETPGLYLFFIVVYTTTSCLFFFFFLFGPIIVMSPLFSPSSLMPQSGIEGNSKKKKKKKKKELLGGVPSVCLKCEEAATISPHLVSWKSSSSIRKQQQKKKRKCTAEVD